MDELIVERSGSVVTVILDRPPVNALTLQLYRRITEVFREISAGDANCAVLTARGDTFCAGVDLTELSNLAAEDDPKRSAVVREMYRTVRA